MKPWYYSKIIWANLITLVIAITVAIAGSDLVTDYPQVSAVLLSVVSGLNIVLRWLTDKPITSVLKPMDSLRPRISDNEHAKRYQVK